MKLGQLTTIYHRTYTKFWPYIYRNKGNDVRFSDVAPYVSIYNYSIAVTISSRIFVKKLVKEKEKTLTIDIYDRHRQNWRYL